MNVRITVNGKEYRGVEEMPPEVRRQYARAMSMLADKDGNGVPDILEGGASITSTTFDHAGDALITTEVTKSDVVVNGQRYARLEDVPAELRELICNATAGAFTAGESARSDAISFDVGTRAARRDPANDPGGFGITFRLTWPLLFAVFTVALIALVVAWLVTR
jgi:hypothetical protein